MNRKTKLLLALSALIFFTAAALVGGDALARDGSGSHAPGVSIQKAESSLQTGGRYQLSGRLLQDHQGIFLQSGGPLSGGGYRLERLPTDPQAGEMCCCVYLPCVRR